MWCLFATRLWVGCYTENARSPNFGEWLPNSVAKYNTKMMLGRFFVVRWVGSASRSCDVVKHECQAKDYLDIPNTLFRSKPARMSSGTLLDLSKESISSRHSMSETSVR